MLLLELGTGENQLSTAGDETTFQLGCRLVMIFFF